jgi:hypothetical protein
MSKPELAVAIKAAQRLLIRASAGHDSSRPGSASSGARVCRTASGGATSRSSGDAGRSSCSSSPRFLGSD